MNDEKTDRNGAETPKRSKAKKTAEQLNFNTEIESPEVKAGFDFSLPSDGNSSKQSPQDPDDIFGSFDFTKLQATSFASTESDAIYRNWDELPFLFLGGFNTIQLFAPFCVTVSPKRNLFYLPTGPRGTLEIAGEKIESFSYAPVLEIETRETPTHKFKAALAHFQSVAKQLGPDILSAPFITYREKREVIRNGEVTKFHELILERLVSPVSLMPQIWGESEPIIRLARALRQDLADWSPFREFDDQTDGPSFHKLVQRAAQRRSRNPR
jgi:hypothetical protein